MVSDRPNLDILRKAIGDVPFLTYCDKIASTEPSPYENLIAVEEWNEARVAIEAWKAQPKPQPKPQPIVRHVESIILLSRKNERLLKRLLFGCLIGRRIKRQHPHTEYFERLERCISHQKDYYGNNYEHARPKMEGIMVPEPLWVFFKDRYARNGSGLMLSLKKMLQ